MFSKGQYYKYAGPRTTEELAKFAREGFKSVSSEAVPGPPTLLSLAKRHWDVVLKDFLTLLGTKKNVLLVTFSGGLLVGLLLGCFCNCADSSKNKKSKTS
jgi:hypothetical protein